MGWSNFWLESTSRAAQRRRRRYEVEPPPAVRRSLEQQEAALGVLDSIRLISYLLLGTFKGLATLAWRFLADHDTPKRKREIETLTKGLRERLTDGSTLAKGGFERRLYSRDLANVPKIMEKLLFRTTPLAVVHVRSEKDIIAVMRFANERGIPVTPRGVSSSAFGGTIPTRNGIVLDLSPMSRILEVDPGRLTVRLQPSVRWADLAETIARFGLSVGPTPSSRFSTVAGWVTTGGLGMESLKYGHVRDWIVWARVILPGGSAVELDGQDERLRYLFGTEGQFGIITELVMRVRLKNDFGKTLLLFFDNIRTALTFADRLIRTDCKPSHIVFYNRARLAEENLLLRDRLGLAEPVLEENEAVLVHFDDPESEKAFETAVQTLNSGRLSEGPAADYLWSERFFPLKAQRLGPNLLAAEVLIGRPALPKYIPRAQRLARRFGIDLGSEVIFADEGQCIAIGTFPCDSRKSASYALYLLFVQMLVQLATRLGGSPYGIGLWNTPFMRKRYPADTRRELRRLKKEMDPKGILNPRKFFGLRTRFFNGPGLFFKPAVYSSSLAAMRLFSPFVGLMAKVVKPAPVETWKVPVDGEGTTLLEQTALRCTFCGACVSVCPAYLLTRDELATGRTKLKLFEAVQSGKAVSPAETARAFQCLHCSLCEEVCQTRLPLVDCYFALESLLEERFGRPDETLARFVESVDTNREWIEQTFGLSVAEWTPQRRTDELLKAGHSAVGGKL
jgi:FAD/FMN-containing dehydrogenase/ferredoxin